MMQSKRPCQVIIVAALLMSCAAIFAQTVPGDNQQLHFTGNFAKVKAANGKFFGLKVNAEIFADDSNYKWSEVPAALKNFDFCRPNSKSQGVIDFEVVTAGKVIMAVTTDYFKSGDGPWKKDLTTRDQLIQQGWQPVGTLRGHYGRFYGGVENDTWEMFIKECSNGEKCHYRTEKYCAPIIIVRN